jgi:DNA-binding response OmpR family regulator
MRGYAVSEAATLAEAMPQAMGDADDDGADGCPPEWILLDLMLPDGVGTDLLRRLRFESVASKVCVITGCGAGMLGEVEALGPDHIFTKPLDVDRLLDAMGAPAI